MKKTLLGLGLASLFGSTAYAAWTDPTLGVGDFIKAVHITELRDSIVWGDNATYTGNINYAGGNVGIGVASPDARLDVAGAIQATSHIESGVGAGGVALTLNDGYGNANLTFNHTAGRASQNGNAGRIEVNKDSSTNAKMFFELGDGLTAGVATSLSSIMTLQSNGNVGIGTVNPFQKLQVVGSGVSAFASSGWQAGFGEAGAGEVLVGTYANQPAIQGQGTGTSFRLLLNPHDGNVGIGTVNPGEKLQVEGGNIRVNSGGNGRVYFGPTGTQYIYGDGGSALYARSNHATVSQLIFQDSDGDAYGRVYGAQGDSIGFLDGDGQWAYRHAKDSLHEFRVNNIVMAQLRANGESLSLYGDNHAYIGLYPDGSAAGRRAYIGFGAASSNDLVLDNQFGSGISLNLQASGNAIFGGTVSVGTPTSSNHATTKAYVDSAVGGITGGDDLGNHTTTQQLIMPGGLGIDFAHPTSGVASLGWEDNYLRYRFGGTATPIGIRLDNYDTVGVELTRTGRAYFAGNVGIGAVTPNARLEIEGGSNNWDTAAQGTGVGSIHLDPENSAANYGSAITWGASDSSSGDTAQAGIYVRSDGTYGTRMYLSTTSSYSTGAQTALMIDNTRNVGIGTTAPLGKLSVNTTRGLGAGEGLRVTDALDGGNNRVVLRTSTNGHGIIEVSNTSEVVHSAITNSVTYFNGSSVGIGDTTPDGGLRLDVSGNVGASAYCDTAGNNCSSAAAIAAGISAAGDNLGSHAATQDLNLNNNSIANIQQLNAISRSKPGIYLDSISTGDNWDNQGSVIRIGESASSSTSTAAMNMTYVGNGRGYVGAGLIEAGNGVPSGGFFEFVYNSPTINTSSNLNVNGALTVQTPTSNNHATTKAYVDSAVSSSGVGFTPVQQGGGIGQTPNKVYIGWSSGNALKATVDATDLGEVWTSSSDGPGSGLNADLLDGQSSAYYQRRVTGTCAAGSSIRAIAANGTVTCESDDSGSGGDNLGSHTATTTLNMSNLDVDNVGFLDFRAATGEGIRFWGSNTYKISMGDAAEYKYGGVTDFSIKNAMSNNSNRGWTWGVAGVAPRVAFTTAGNAQFAGVVRAEGGFNVDGTTVINSTGGIIGDQIVNGSIDQSEVDSTVIQSRVTGNCPAGQSIRVIAENGTVTCEVDNGGDNLGNHTATQNISIGANDITGTSGAIITAGSFIYASDKNLKTNIKPLEGSHNVLDLGTYRYDWKDSKTSDIGVIAQEVERYFPEFVQTNTETGYKGVDYVKLVVPLLEVTKAQEAKINALETRLEALEAQ